MIEDNKKFYRCESNYSGYNGSIHVYIHAFYSIKATPCGYWIDYYGKRKWTSTKGKKRLAYPTKELAIESFKRRKLRQLYILAIQTKAAEAALAVADTDYIDLTTKNI